MQASDRHSTYTRRGSRCIGRVMLVLMLTLLLIGAGCAQSQKTSKASGSKHKRDARQVRQQSSVTTSTRLEVPAEDDPTDPTATRLHDLAGKILMHRLMHHRLPATLEEFAGPSDIVAGTGEGIDPATRRLFIYTPDSPINRKLPGRVILHQPLSQGARGRWALLINDLASDGQVITYVQRVPDGELPRVRE